MVLQAQGPTELLMAHVDLAPMCFRIVQSSPPQRLELHIASMVHPSDDAALDESGVERHWVVRQNPKTGERVLEKLSWGFIHHWSRTRQSRRRPKTTRADVVVSSPYFGDAYRRRRCLVPVDEFIECKAFWGPQRMRFYAFGMKSREPFALGGIWENWQDPVSGRWIRTFAILTTQANDLIEPVREWMPLIIPPVHYDRWLSRLEFGPRDLLVPFPSEPLWMRPLSTTADRPKERPKQRW